MTLLVVIVIVTVLAFSLVVFVGAPYLPTTRRQINAGLELLNLSPGQRMLELGAGDGRVALAALKKGVNVTEIDLNPLLCVVIYIRTFRYRRNIQIKCGNYWHMQWGEFDGLYVFLLDKYMERLDKMLIHKQFTGPLASFAFKVPHRRHVRELAGVYLYRYE